MSAVLLDTCAIIFIADGRPIAPAARREVASAIAGAGVLISPVSAWEIGLLSAHKGIAFRPDPQTWFASFLSQPGVRLTPLTPEIAIESTSLPPVAMPSTSGAKRRSRPKPHADPADRLLIATACALDVPIVTRDRAILAYAAAGFVKAIAC